MGMNLSLHTQTQANIPGILGGMGPLSHVFFEQQLIEQHRSKYDLCSSMADQDYPLWITINATQVPDRTQCILEQKEDCLKQLLYYSQCLESFGANFIVVICNTSHIYHRQVSSELKIPWIHLIEETAKFIAHAYPQIRYVGVLSTDGTLSTQLYQQHFSNYKIVTIEPPLNSPTQKNIMNAIYHPIWGIKRTGTEISLESLHSLHQSIDWLKQHGAELIVTGCTELSIALKIKPPAAILWIDPLKILADVTLDFAFGLRNLSEFNQAHK
ncbi:putative aspartate racemase [[Synechococcus] sp. NIES-970]|nr:putative aspartate racemase [[Synechococcus] sp. NIES-970]